MSVKTMLGAISAYLLIALGFALLTAGLGDLAPVSPVARLLTGAEAIIGQVHLAWLPVVIRRAW